MENRLHSLRSITVFAFAIISLLSISLHAYSTTYYSGASGSPATLTLWWTATNATGTHPANFTNAGNVFEIQNTHTMTTTGNWTVAGTVLIDNGGKLAVTSTGTTVSFGAFTISSGGIAIINRPLVVTGATNISGTITFGSTSTNARLMTFTGNTTLSSGASWNQPGTGNGANNTFNFGGNFTNNATSFNDLGTGVHTFSGAAKTISGSTITSIGSVAVTGTLTNTGTLTVRTALSGGGTLTNGNGTSGTLNIGGTVTITNLAATAANNLVNYTGAAQTAKVTTYNNLTLSGSLAKTFATTPTVNGILSMEGTATIAVTTGNVTYGANATLQYNTATSRTVTSEEWLTTFAASGGIIIANTGVIILNEAKVFNASIPLTINNGATLDTKTGSNFSLTFGGNFVNNGALNNACPALFWITDDIDGQPRAAMTDYGADEFSPSPRLSSENAESQATLDVYPNPFESTIHLYVTVAKDSKVSLSLYNMLGLRISDVFEETLSAGNFDYTYNGAHLSAGVYICRMVVVSGDNTTVIMKRIVKDR